MSVDDTIRTSLERLVQPLADLDAVVAEVDRRRERNRRRHTGTRVLLAVACVGVLGGGAAMVGKSGSESGSDDVRAQQPPSESPMVTVATSGLGVLRITTSGVRDAGEGWLEHTVTIENTGAETVYLNDLRTGQFLGDREVLATTEGCGYAGVPGEPVEVACHKDYRPLAIEPGARSDFSVTLWADLDGMNAVTGTTFVLRIPIVQSDTAFSSPSQAGTQGELVLTYSHLRPANQSDDSSEDYGLSADAPPRRPAP